MEREQGLIQILTELDGFQSQGSKVFLDLIVYNNLMLYDCVLRNWLKSSIC